VRPARERLERDDRLRGVISLGVVAARRGRDDVVLAEGDEKQRRATGLAEVGRVRTADGTRRALRIRRLGTTTTFSAPYALPDDRRRRSTAVIFAQSFLETGIR